MNNPFQLFTERITASLSLSCCALLLAFGLSACNGGEEVETGAVETDTLAMQQDTMGIAQNTTGGQYGAFTDWNENQDDEITEDEFGTAFGEYGNFNEWDQDASGGLDETEFSGGVFENWNENNDDVWEEDEWNTWTETWFGDEADYGTWDDWDADANNELTQTEFEEGFGEYGNYGEWDANTDNQVGETEFSEGVFDLWDEDDSAGINENEWNTSSDWWFAY